MTNQIYLAEISVKTRTGTHVDRIICIKKPLEEMQKDRHIAWRLQRKKLEGFKDSMVKDKETGFPKIEKVEWLKYLSDSNV